MAKVLGLKKIQERLRKEKVSEGRIRSGLRDALWQMGFIVMADAKRHTPVAAKFGGTLRASGYVNDPYRRNRGPRVEIGFGTDYAIYVHEITTNRHKIGEAKFLSKAINRASLSWTSTMAALMIKRIKTKRSPKRTEPTSSDING